MDLDVTYNQYGERATHERREVRPPIRVEEASWTAAGELDWWVRERGAWWGRVTGRDGLQRWIKAADLRRTEVPPALPRKTLLERTAAFREPTNEPGQ